jgi:ADP-ribose pyrophosphatase YjhB (NUDIX family)
MTTNTPLKQIYTHYQPGGEPAGGFRYCPACGAPMTTIQSGGRLRQACPGCGFVQHRNPAPAVSVLVAEGERVLLGKRKGNPGRGTWALPSGYIDFEEDFLAAAIREAKEETGLEVALGSILNVTSSFVSPSFHFLGIYLLARATGGELAAGDDLEEVRWFRVDELPAEMGFAEDVDAIAMYAQGVAGLPVGALYPSFTCTEDSDG